MGFWACSSFPIPTVGMTANSADSSGVCDGQLNCSYFILKLVKVKFLSFCKQDSLGN